MGLCSNRHFLLTICTLQLVTTIERQVFDFLGFMWVPILVNFFNIIFVILGFFGAFQYRPKYIISYCVWNVLWLGWNVFLTCFYLNAGILDKDSDLLNLGTGSFSWWQINGPGCKPHYNNTVPDRPDVYRPVRPDQVTGCILDYEIIEVLHSSTQCLLAVMAVIGGICLSRVFLEEDDSFDFVGGGDFGMAGHTPLHPMYVSYSALPAPGYTHSKAHSGSGDSYYYPSNTATTTSGSHRSSHGTLMPPPASSDARNPRFLAPKPAAAAAPTSSALPPAPAARVGRPQQPPPPPDTATLTTTAGSLSSADAASCRLRALEYADYSSPIDQLPAQRPDYASLEAHSPSPSLGRGRYSQPAAPHLQAYSPLMRSRQFARNGAAARGPGHSNRNSYRPTRVHADHIREQQSPTPPPLPPPSRLRSFHSDPRLAAEEQTLSSPPRERAPPDGSRRRDNRPMSMFVNNY